MVETGFTRAKNAGNIVMKNFMNGVWAVCFLIITGLMFGTDIGGLTGAPDFCAKRLWASYPSWPFYLQTFSVHGGDYCMWCHERTKFSFTALQYFDQRVIYPVSGVDLGRRRPAPWVFMILPVLRRSRLVV
ncbi:MAG: hypothetical protein ACLR2G_04370 [Phascolarctobacterium faecium]